MLWRSRCFLRRSIPLLRLLHTTTSENLDPIHHLPRRRAKLTITPQLVHSTLSNCHSDLIALRFFLWCATQPNYFHDRHAFLHMVDVLVRITDRYRSVRAVVKELQSIGSPTKAQTFLLLLRIYWTGGQYILVFETFKEMEDFGYTPNTFAHNVVMDVYFKIRRVDLAPEALRKYRAPNFLTFNTALTNFCKVKDLGNVGDVIRSMLEKGFYPNIETLGLVFSCFSNAGRFLEALPLLSLMIKLGFSISVNIWSMLIHGYCRLHRTHIAELLLEKMVQSGCSPNVVTCTSLIKRLMESRMFHKAFRILKTIDSDVDLVFYNVLIDSLRKNGFHEDALAVYCTLLDKKLVPDGYTFSALVSTLSSSRMFYLSPEAVKCLILEEDLDLVSCNSLLRYLSRAGLPSLAKLLHKRMIIRGLAPDNYTFVGLLDGFCAARQIGEAICFYHQLLKRHQNLDPHVHTSIMSGLVKVGKYRQAVRLFMNAVMKGYALDAISYTVAIHGLFMDGRGSEAYALFDQMKEVGIKPTVHTYNVMLSGFCREKDGKMVVKILQEMVEARVILWHRNFFRVGNFICSACYRHTVSNLLDEMEDLGLLLAETTFFRHRFVQGVHTNSSLIGRLSENSSTDASCSEDICDVAASVG